MTKELAGKIAFVTGSGRGLGRVMAERLAELGADVAIHDISWTAPAKYGEAADLEGVLQLAGAAQGAAEAVQQPRAFRALGDDDAKVADRLLVALFALQGGAEFPGQPVVAWPAPPRLL